ncbi:twin-arginine translocase TatA/TatE family subunit [Planctobacterium marinum]|uniref:twin-arginine translocase TatA/TatE family subunit n=1 Tax=Planctobacterium marinum TaxID=1631968 RepID=UPI001E465BCB|nr:twin-arginine translocase TatA/TatE family subunit [Planctobacterium marinum]MCC2607063.1 twin-arginine translocase TatA/TatE family subunit [Planctobacterium marinum]
MGGISWVQLLIILAIVVLLFGTKKLRSLGSDLGSAVKGFKSAVTDENKPDADFKEPEGVQDQSNKQQTTQSKEKQNAE